MGQRGSWMGTGGLDPRKSFVILVVRWVHETQAGKRSYYLWTIGASDRELPDSSTQIFGAKAVAKRSSQISIFEVSNLRGKYFKYCFHTLHFFAMVKSI